MITDRTKLPLIMRKLIAIIIISLFFVNLQAQNVAITDEETYNAHSSAMLDVYSNSKGFLTPRLTSTQRLNIVTPAEGLLVYDTSFDGFYYYDGTQWIDLSSGTADGPFWLRSDPYIFTADLYDSVGIGINAPIQKMHIRHASTDVSGTNGTFLQIQNSSGSYGVMSGIRFWNGTTVNTSKGGIFYQDRLSYGRGDLILANRPLSDMNNVSAEDARLVLKSEGSVEVKGSSSLGANDALFHVQNSDGDTVFAVYPYGVRVYVSDDATKATGSRCGFAVGGFSPAKGALTNEYLRVTPDSVRVYIDDDYTPVKATGSRGGFAVGVFSPAKGDFTNNYLFIQDDSTRVYVDGDEGFAVDNLNAANQGRYMDLTPANYLIGHHAGSSITSGMHNTFFGYEAGYSNTQGYDNIFIGYQAGYSNVGYGEFKGANNIFIGNQAGFNNRGAAFSEYGHDNIFIGKEAGFNNVNGPCNLFIGVGAGYNNVGSTSSDGGYNIFLGNNAGYSNISGAGNVYVGMEAGYTQTTGTSNSYIGEYAGRDASGSGNTFVGETSGKNSKGNFNTALGAYAGLTAVASVNITNNTFLGAEAGKWMEEGSSNAMVGYNAGADHELGSENVFIGSYAGYGSGGMTVAGDGNVFIGYRAGYYENGSDKLYIENSSSSSPLIWGDFTNNRVVINGNSGHNPNNRTFYANGTAGGDFAWFNDSDVRLKKDIHTIDNALDKVLNMRGVTYFWKEEDKQSMGRQLGFIAQEVEGVLPEVVDNTNDSYSMQYAPITALLVEAVKEQQAIIKKLQEENKKLKKDYSRVDKLEKANDALKAEIDQIKTLLEMSAKK